MVWTKSGRPVTFQGDDCGAITNSVEDWMITVIRPFQPSYRHYKVEQKVLWSNAGTMSGRQPSRASYITDPVRQHPPFDFHCILLFITCFFVWRKLQPPWCAFVSHRELLQKIWLCCKKYWLCVCAIVFFSNFSCHDPKKKGTCCCWEFEILDSISTAYIWSKFVLI